MTKILVVEDDDDLRGIITSALKAAEFNDFIEADDGQKGMEMFVDEPIGFLITDIVMPKVDGITLVKFVRSKDLEVPILVISAFPGKAQDAYDAGANMFLDMPFKQRDLSQCLKKFLSTK